MRALKYRLANGVVVNTLEKAQASGKRYTEILEEIKSPVVMSKAREATVKTVGWCI